MIEINSYISTNFLLTNKLSKSLYHNQAKHLPIVDFHNHLDPAFIVNDEQPKNLSQLWVKGDAYKHRAMRMNGIPENGITGNVSDYDIYISWVKTLPRTLGNPLYQWSYLELKRVFSIDTPLNENSALAIWNECQIQIDSGSHSAVSILNKFNVETLCTSDDLLDNVSIHKKASKNGVTVLPSLRTDSILDQSESFFSWCTVLEDITRIKIKGLDSYEAALKNRFDVFSESGCRLADQALDAGFQFNYVDRSKADSIFIQLLSGERLTDLESISLESYLLIFIGKACAKRNWILQLHVGAQRKTSSRLKNLIGGAGGFAAIGTATDITVLVSVLDTMEQNGQLPKIILYNLNPADNAAFASLAGSFSQDGVTGKIQFGPAWWYNDHYDGIVNQLKALTSHGLLHNSIGMTTDSRSLLSMSRHEYYRRVLSEQISKWVNKGILPDDIEILNELIKDVCYRNANNWILKN